MIVDDHQNERLLVSDHRIGHPFNQGKVFSICRWKISCSSLLNRKLHTFVQATAHKATDICSGKQKVVESNAAAAATPDPIYDRRPRLSEIKRKQPDKEPNANATRRVPQTTRREPRERGHSSCGRGRTAQFAVAGWLSRVGRVAICEVCVTPTRMWTAGFRAHIPF